MNLVIDIGNSRAKVYIYQGDILIADFNYSLLEISHLEGVKANYPLRKAIISTTREPNKEINLWLSNNVGFFIEFSPLNTPIPLKNDYKTPATLGADRLAAAIGANAIKPNKPLIIFDFGTAITIDFVENNTYKGGNISPGLTTRFQSLNSLTAKLPLCSTPKTKHKPIGQSTSEAIESGVIEGIIHEISGYINQNSEKNIFFTGGEMKYFENIFKNAIFADCELVSKGLNQILEYNAKINT